MESRVGFQADYFLATIGTRLRELKRKTKKNLTTSSVALPDWSQS
jgi:hypothetical protein